MRQRHASLMDVFSAGMQAASPFLQRETAKMKEENDLQLNNDAVRFKNDLDNYLRDNLHDPGNFDEYNGRLQEFTSRWFDAETKGNTSPYYQRAVEAMKTQSLEAVRNIAMVEKDKHDYKQRDVDYFNERNKIRNAEGLAPEIKFKAVMNAHELHARRQKWDPSARAKDMAEIYSELFDGALAIDVNKAATVSQAEDLIKKNVEELERLANEREGEDGVLEKKIANKQNRIQDANGAARMAIWKRNYGNLKTKDAEYQRIARDAVKAGDYGLMLYAQDLYWDGSERRETALGSSEYDPDNYDEIARMFPRINGLSGEGGRSGGADEIKKAALTGKLKELLSEVVAGRGGEFGSIHDFNQKFRGMLYTWAYDNNFYSGRQESFEVEFADVLEKFYDFAKEAVKESPEALSAITMTEQYVKDLTGNNSRNAKFMGKKYADVTAHASAAIMSGLMDEIYTFDNRNPKQGGAAFFDAVTGMLGVVNAEALEALGEIEKTGDDALIDIVEALGNRHIVHTNEHGQVVTMPGPANDPGRMSKRVENSRNVLAGRIAEIKGLDPDKLVAHNKKDVSGYDEDAAPEFQYDGGSTWYRWAVQEEGNKKQLVLESRSGLNGEWKEDRVVDRRAEDRAADREFQQYQDSRSRREQEVTERFERNRSEYARMITEGKDPRTGRDVDFNYLTEPPPGSEYSRENWNRKTSRGLDAVGETVKRRAWFDYYLKQAREER